MRSRSKTICSPWASMRSRKLRNDAPIATRIATADPTTVQAVASIVEASQLDPLRFTRAFRPPNGQNRPLREPSRSAAPATALIAGRASLGRAVAATATASAFVGAQLSSAREDDRRINDKAEAGETPGQATPRSGGDPGGAGPGRTVTVDFTPGHPHVLPDGTSCSDRGRVGRPRTAGRREPERHIEWDALDHADGDSATLWRRDCVRTSSSVRGNGVPRFGSTCSGQFDQPHMAVVGREGRRCSFAGSVARLAVEQPRERPGARPPSPDPTAGGLPACFSQSTSTLGRFRSRPNRPRPRDPAVRRSGSPERERAPAVARVAQLLKERACIEGLYEQARKVRAVVPGPDNCSSTRLAWYDGPASPSVGAGARPADTSRGPADPSYRSLRRDAPVLPRRHALLRSMCRATRPSREATMRRAPR